MNFELFSNLTEDEARQFLVDYLEQEGTAWAEAEPAMLKTGIKTKIAMDNIASILIWFFEQLETMPVKPDLTLPHWIRATDSYTNGLFEFDEQSKILILRGAYLLGECFVIEHKSLSWDIGDAKSAVKHMPVVNGFKHSMEMSPIMVVENIYKKVLADGAPIDCIQNIINTWQGFIKNDCKV